MYVLYIYIYIIRDKFIIIIIVSIFEFFSKIVSNMNDLWIFTKRNCATSKRSIFQYLHIWNSLWFGPSIRGGLEAGWWWPWSPLQCLGRLSRWKEDTEPKASTTIYIFVSLSEMPCSRLYILIPVSNFSFE